MLGTVTDIQRFSLNDGPGIRTTVFLKGCNLHCAWCHNPETIRKKNELMVYPANCISCGHCVPVCPSGARSIAAGVLQFDRSRCTGCGACAAICFPGALKMAGRQVSVEEVMEEIRQDNAYYADSGGGVTLSGGEVFCQSEFADALIDACREEKIPVAVETNLNWQFESARPILEKLDLIMFDVKIFDSVEHKRWTGVENAELLDNARRLDTLDRPLIARTPLIPGATDSAENIRAIAGFLRNFRNLRCYELLNFNPLGDSKYRALEEKNPFVSARPLKPEALNRLREAAESVGNLTIQIG
ncbi:glycyl-radical enzyme activating protein [uncultured Victivallis sp.]|uniref:glycyl-radical enzyme activating protein n=1 Tax=uncultured Victivallis sp. TaxID=354118 RepID=UPI0025FC96CF|nr:glycyl-radical enzyme activating protein [uncultured Victivallis sp.]